MNKIKKSLKVRKNSLIIIGISFILITISVIFCSLYFSEKSAEKISKILKNKKYKTFYSIGINNYDERDMCYLSGDYTEKVECKREVNIYDSANVILRKDDNNSKVSASIKYDKNYKITDMNIEFEPEKDINNLELKKIGINKDELNSYFQWYFKNYIKDKIKKSKNLSKLSYDEILKYIKKYNYEILVDENSISLLKQDSYSFTTYSFDIANDKVDMMFYSRYNSNYDLPANGIKLYYYIDKETYVGSNDYNECMYVIDSSDEKLKGQILDGKKCSEETIKNMEITLQIDYPADLYLMELTQEELISFAEEYYLKNK